MTPRRPDLRQLERVLIVKLSSIGDVVHALPVSAALGEAFPHLKLTWIVEERAAPIVRDNPYLHEVIVLQNDWHLRPLSRVSLRRFAALRRGLLARRFDLAIDLQGLTRSALLAWATGARYRLGCDWLRELAPLLVRRVRRRKSVHIVDQLLDVARFLGAPVTRVRFPLHIPEADEASSRDLLAGVGIAPEEPFLAVNPTEGGYGRKGWGRQHLVALLRALACDGPLPAVLVGGAEDRELGDAIMTQVEPPPGNLIGRTSLKQLAAVLRHATVHVSADTGSAHIAAALGTPVVSIFGRTNPARLAPYGQAERVLHHREQCAIACRWYHRTAPLNCNQVCFAQSPACLAAVTVEEVATLVRRCLKQRLAAQQGVLRPVGEWDSAGADSADPLVSPAMVGVVGNAKSRAITDDN
jgi:heptosyltransferase-1